MRTWAIKGRLTALALALLTALGGCSAMLEREYQSVEPHVRLSVAEDDSNAVWAESYSELQGAILAQVKTHQEVGVIRLKNWKGDVEEQLTRACDEVSHSAPLGAYAVDRIQHSFTRMVSYYEATITIDFRRTAEQIAAVATVTGSGAIRAELVDALDGFVTETAFQINYFDETQDADYIRDLVREAYYDLPAAALGLPEVQVQLYPDQGSRRVVEVLLSYPEESKALQSKRVQLETAATDLVEPYRTGLKDTALAAALFNGLRERTRTDAAAGATAYHALVEGAADSEGMALAYKELCDLAGLPCRIVEGALGEDASFWTIVTLEEGSRHVDPAQADGLLLTDAQMAQAGYTWPDGEYPLCGESPVPAEENVEN